MKHSGIIWMHLIFHQPNFLLGETIIDTLHLLKVWHWSATPVRIRTVTRTNASKRPNSVNRIRTSA